MVSESAARKTQPLVWKFWLVIFFAAFIRFFGLGGKQLWVDEIIQAIHSSPKPLTEMLRAVTEDRGATPLDYVIQHWVANLLGPSEFTLRLHAAVFGVLTIAALYYIGRAISNQRAAMLAAALYAVYPLHHHYSQEGRPYALFTFLTAASYLVFWKLLSSRRVSLYFGYAAITTLLLYSNYYAVFVILPQFAFSACLLVPRLRISLPEVKAVTVSFLSKLLTAIVLAAALFTPWIVFGIRTISGYEPSPERFDLKLLFRFIKELSDGSYPLSILLIVFAIFGARRLISERKHGCVVFLLGWFLLPIPLIFLMLWLKDYFFAIRQILFVTPALYVLVSLGIFHIAEIIEGKHKALKSSTAAFLAALVALVSLVQIALHIPDRRDDLKAAGQYLRENVQNSDLVIAPTIGGPLSYYFPAIHAHLQPVAGLSSLSDALLPGRSAFVVEMTEKENLSMDTLVRARFQTEEVTLRGMKITKIYAAK